MTETVDRLFQKVKGEGTQEGHAANHALIERTLREIGKEYRSGLLGWIIKDRGEWRRLLDLEDQINQKDGLTAALGAYKRFFSEALSVYGEGNLFGDK